MFLLRIITIVSLCIANSSSITAMNRLVKGVMFFRDLEEAVKRKDYSKANDILSKDCPREGIISAELLNDIKSGNEPLPFSAIRTGDPRIMQLLFKHGCHLEHKMDCTLSPKNLPATLLGTAVFLQDNPDMVECILHEKKAKGRIGDMDTITWFHYAVDTYTRNHSSNPSYKDFIKRFLAYLPPTEEVCRTLHNLIMLVSLQPKATPELLTLKRYLIHTLRFLSGISNITRFMAPATPGEIAVYDNNTMLHTMAELGMQEGIEYVLGRQPNFLEQRNNAGDAPIHTLTRECPVEETIQGMRYRHSFHAILKDDHAATECRRTTSKGWTPLHLAMHLKKVFCAAQLLVVDESTLDITVVCGGAEVTPRSIGTKNGLIDNPLLRTFFISKNIQAFQAHQQQLLAAIHKADVKRVQALLSPEACATLATTPVALLNMPLQNADNPCMLGAAIKTGNYNLVETIVAAGADINKEQNTPVGDHPTSTPLAIAINEVVTHTSTHTSALAKEIFDYILSLKSLDQDVLLNYGLTVQHATAEKDRYYKLVGCFLSRLPAVPCANMLATQVNRFRTNICDDNLLRIMGHSSWFFNKLAQRINCFTLNPEDNLSLSRFGNVSILHTMAELGNCIALEILAKDNPTLIRQLDSYGLAPIHRLIKNAPRYTTPQTRLYEIYKNSLKSLLKWTKQHSIAIDLPSGKGLTPLCMAFQCQQPEFARILIEEYGANLEHNFTVKGKFTTVAEYAQTSGIHRRPELVEYFARYAADQAARAPLVTHTQTLLGIEQEWLASQHDAVLNYTQQLKQQELTGSGLLAQAQQQRLLLEDEETKDRAFFVRNRQACVTEALLRRETIKLYEEVALLQNEQTRSRNTHGQFVKEHANLKSELVNAKEALSQEEDKNRKLARDNNKVSHEKRLWKSRYNRTQRLIMKLRRKRTTEIKLLMAAAKRDQKAQAELVQRQDELIARAEHAETLLAAEREKAHLAEEERALLAIDISIDSGDNEAADEDEATMAPIVDGAVEDPTLSTAQQNFTAPIIATLAHSDAPLLLNAIATDMPQIVIDQLIYMGYSPFEEYEGYTVLHWAILWNKVDAIYALLFDSYGFMRDGASDLVNYATETYPSYYPLQTAVTVGNSWICEVLLTCGAQVTPQIQRLASDLYWEIADTNADTLIIERQTIINLFLTRRSR